ncbi:MAG TPA: HlyD family efflux transporter periplasmic adaptor subunit [Bacteroidota bacterium]
MDTTAQDVKKSNPQSGMDRKIEKPKWPPKKIALIAGGALFASFILYSFIFGDSSSRLNVEAERITISAVSRGPFQEFIPVNGAIQPIETFYLDVVEGGRVERIFSDAGTMVKKGDPILRLANTNLQLDVMYREALTYEQINNAQNRRLAIEQNTIAVKGSLADVESQASQAILAFTRDSALFGKNLISPEEFNRSKSEYDRWQQRLMLARENAKQDSILRVSQLVQLESSISRLELNLRMVQNSVDNLTVRAPIGGQLTSLNAEIGQSKSPGQRLGQIDVLENFKVRAAIDEFYIARINIGQTGEFDLGGQTYRLEINKVFPEVREGRFEVDMLFTGKTPPGVRRGQTLQIRLELGDLSEATLLARGGFYQRTGGQWVYVVDPSGDFAVKRTIKLGRQNPQMFEVLEGIEPGEQVITSSYETFGDIDKLILNR